MDFISNQQPQIEEMLKSLHMESIDALFEAIPKELKINRPAIEDGLSEFEGLQMMEKLAAKNTFPFFENYLGAGAYEHHIPALVQAVCSKSEFLTAYTPYQAEASQGMLQIIFEFQSAICALTGMDAANASVYDGASACAEGLLMALRLQKPRSKILVAETLHPHYRGVINQYLHNLPYQIETLPFGKNLTLDDVQVDKETAAILVQSPNFFGCIEQVQQIAQHAKAAGALTILCANPLSYGLYPSAGELGVDIAVGDCQPFGIPLQFGGPYAGYMACRQEFVRQLPGRIAGETLDTKGRRGFVLTLQAREQHIRRDKATSNICTNQALAALASLITLLWYGKRGIPALALTNFQRASYLREKLSAFPGIVVDKSTPIFNEFTARFDRPLDKLQGHFRKKGIEPGLALGRYFSLPGDRQGYHLLIAVTETKSKEQLDRYIEVAREALA